MVVYPNRKQYNTRQQFSKTTPPEPDPTKPNFLHYDYWIGSLTRAFSPDDEYVAWSVAPSDNASGVYVFDYWSSPYGTYSDVVLMHLETKTKIKLNFPDAHISTTATASRPYLNTSRILFNKDSTRVAIFNYYGTRIDSFAISGTTATHLSTFLIDIHSTYDFTDDKNYITRADTYFVINYNYTYKGRITRFDFDTLTPVDLFPTVTTDMSPTAIRVFEDGKIVVAGYRTVAAVRVAYVRIVNINDFCTMSEYYPTMVPGKNGTGEVCAFTKYAIIFKKTSSSDTMKCFSLVDFNTYPIANGPLGTRSISENRFPHPYFKAYVALSPDEKNILYVYTVSSVQYYIIYSITGNAYVVKYSGTIIPPATVTIPTETNMNKNYSISNNSHIIYADVQNADMTVYQYGTVMFDAITQTSLNPPLPDYIPATAVYSPSSMFYDNANWSRNADFLCKPRRVLIPATVFPNIGLLYNNSDPLTYNTSLGDMIPKTYGESVGGAATNAKYTALPCNNNTTTGNMQNPYTIDVNMLYSNTGKYGIFTMKCTSTDGGVVYPIKIFNLDAVNPKKSFDDEDDEEPVLVQKYITTRHQINR